MTHSALQPERIDRLQAVVGNDGTDLPPAPPPTGLNAKARMAAKRVVRKAIAWYVDDKAQDTADAAVAKLARQLRERDETPQIKVNLELLKGEVRALLRMVEELGMAIAPATGIEGAGARMAELREGLHQLERRLRNMDQVPVAAAAAPAPTPATPPPSLPNFDYTAFERRFRGDPAAVLNDLHDRYFDVLRHHAPVLDVGCGRGELLAALAAEGIEGSGVDNDAEMLAEARAAGVEVHLGDAVEYLRGIPEGSVGAITAIQVVEHLPFGMVLELVELARTRLRPGGIFVAETPNPASLIVLGNSYILDPTHVQPLHPSLLAFVYENAGYRDVRVHFWAPAVDYHLPPVEDPTVNAAFEKLNRVLFGPQDYAVIATTPPGATAIR